MTKGKKGPEDKYCRPYTKWLFNHLSGSKWLPNYNIAAIIKNAGGSSDENNDNDIEPETQFGRPDGFVCWNGDFLAIECKGAYKSVYLGDPNKKESSGWHLSQRVWYSKVAQPTRMEYYIALWVYPHEKPARIKPDMAAMYIVPVTAWLQLETQLDGCKTASFTMVTSAFAPYRLEWNSTERHFVPPRGHPIYHGKQHSITREYIHIGPDC